VCSSTSSTKWTNSLSNEPEPLLEIAYVTRAHGLRGEVVAAPVSNRVERFQAGARWTIGDTDYEVIAARPQGDRYVVQLDGVGDRNAAEALRGATAYAPPLGPLPEGELWVHELVGSQCVDTHGAVLGTVEAVEDNPAHDLLVLDNGMLIPMVFVVAHDADACVVTVDPPEGLVELFSTS
jgi:16S rRNA processing protein RimM